MARLQPAGWLCMNERCNMGRKKDPGLIIPAQYFKQIAKLKSDEAGLLLQSLICYMQDPDTEEPELSGRATAVYEMLCDDIDGNVEAYRQKQDQGKAAAERQWEEKRKEQARLAELEKMVAQGSIAENAQSMGADKSERAPMGTHTDPSLPMGADGSARGPKVLDKTRLDKTGLDRTKRESTPQTPQGATESDQAGPASRQKRFVKPTVAEVAAYAAERGRPDFNAEHFIDHYDSNGWFVGKNKMRDWKAAVRTWISRDKEFSRGQSASRNNDKPDIYTDWSEDIAKYSSPNTAAGPLDSGVPPDAGDDHTDSNTEWDDS